MPVPTVFDLCTPRPDILQGRVTEAEFAADLARVLADEAGTGYADYADPARFFANTYPTRGLKDLLANVCRRLSGAGGEVAAIFRLDTSYGGGKTHGLIALAHAAKGMQGVAEPEEFIDPSLLPGGPVRVAAFDGENADPANGRMLENGVLAKTPWGELAHALAGKQGFERVRTSDEKHMAPGASTLRELFGDQPTLILLDELSVYLRSVQSISEARGPTHGVPDPPAECGGEHSPSGSRLHAGHRQGQSGKGRVQRRKQVHRRRHGGAREGLGSQSDDSESHPRRGNGQGASPTPLRGG